MELQHRDGNPWLVLAGDVDMRALDQIAGELRAHACDADVWVDLGRVEFMDASGLAILVTASNSAQVVHLVDVPSFVMRLIELAGTSSLFDLV